MLALHSTIATSLYNRSRVLYNMMLLYTAIEVCHQPL